jgi:hypothetical protein
VAAGGPDEVRIDPEGGEAVALANGVHGVEQRRLGAREPPSLSRRPGKEDGENYEKYEANMSFSKHSRQFELGK